MNKEEVVYTKEYDSATENEVWPSATTWMDLKGVMLSEISQRKTNPYDFT